MNPRSNVRVLLSLLIVGFLAFVAIQFIRPHLDNPPVIAELQAFRG